MTITYAEYNKLKRNIINTKGLYQSTISKMEANEYHITKCKKEILRLEDEIERYSRSFKADKKMLVTIKSDLAQLNKEFDACKTICHNRGWDE